MCVSGIDCLVGKKRWNEDDRSFESAPCPIFVLTLQMFLIAVSNIKIAIRSTLIVRCRKESKTFK